MHAVGKATAQVRRPLVTLGTVCARAPVPGRDCCCVKASRMAIGRLVPWISWEEWTTVYCGLFAADIAQQKAALQQVSLWRCRGKVPLAVDVTGCLTEIGIRDQNSRNSDAELSEALRLQYSMTLVRMVNGISDKAQKGKTATSVSNNAAAAGLPRLLVDVRHEASHNEMPSLALLRLAAAQALDWLHSAYWQRQQAHLQSQHHRVIKLLKEIVALTVGSESHIKPDQTSEQASASSDSHPQAAATPSGNRTQKASEQVEQLHQQQAVLNQLKEMPAKSMNAALLVNPLLDHGILRASDADADATSNAVIPGALLHGIVSALAAVWPSLPAVLLFGAVQRLSSDTYGQQSQESQLPVLTAVIETLLQGHSMPDAQQQPSQNRRRKKRKSTLSDAESARAAGLPVWSVSAAQLKACIADCLAAQPRAEGKRAAALCQVLLVLVQDLKENCAEEYAIWGNRAEQLVSLVHPKSNTKVSHSQQDIHHTARTSDQQKMLAESSSEHILEARKRQKQMLHRVATHDNPVPKASRVWAKVTHWTPCAMGALPSVSDPNGRLSQFDANQSQTPGISPSAAAYQPHASAMAFAVQSAHPGPLHRQTAESADDLTESADSRQELLVLGTVEHNFADYWQRFNAVDTTVVSRSSQPQLQLIPQGKTVKVL